MFIKALMQMATCECNMRLQRTGHINKTLLVHNWWLSFVQFRILFDLVAEKYRLDSCTNLLTQVFLVAHVKFLIYRCQSVEEQVDRMVSQQ